MHCLLGCGGDGVALARNSNIKKQSLRRKIQAYFFIWIISVFKYLFKCNITVYA